MVNVNDLLVIELNYKEGEWFDNDRIKDDLAKAYGVLGIRIPPRAEHIGSIFNAKRLTYWVKSEHAYRSGWLILGR